MSNAYASLPCFNDPVVQDPPTQSLELPTARPTTQDESKAAGTRHQRKAARRRRAKQALQNLRDLDEIFFDSRITLAEDERTDMAKQDAKNGKRITIDNAHKQQDRPTQTLMQRGRNAGYRMGTSLRRAIQHLTYTNQRVRFATRNKTANFRSDDSATMITYDSGADGHYLSEADRKRARLPILRHSTKQVGVANGETSRGVNVTRLPFDQLSPQAATADTFQDFPTSLMSVGKTCDDGNISIFTGDGVTVHKEEDVLITCKGEPILIGVRDERGRYRIPLIQQKGHWQPRRPTKRAKKALNQANSVYDLPSIEQAVKWMHAVCGYPVKSTWLKAIKAGNFIGWPLLTVENVRKYYPETDETPKGHMNQTRKNVRSTKAKATMTDSARAPPLSSNPTRPRLLHLKLATRTG